MIFCNRTIHFDLQSKQNASAQYLSIYSVKIIFEMNANGKGRDRKRASAIHSDGMTLRVAFEWAINIDSPME